VARPASGRSAPKIVTSEKIRRGSPLQFFKDTVAELRKATWPTRQETARLTYIVLIISGLVSAILAILDYGLTQTLTRFVIR